MCPVIIVFKEGFYELKTHWCHEPQSSCALRKISASIGMMDPTVKFRDIDHLSPHQFETATDTRLQFTTTGRLNQTFESLRFLDE